MSIDDILRKAKAGLDYFSLPRFATRPKRLRIATPRRIANPQSIFIGDDVRIGPSSVLAGCRAFNGPNFKQNFTPTIHIGSRVAATSALQVYCAEKVVIEDDVLIAANVFISDYAHGFSNVEVPFSMQAYCKISPVRVGHGSWIGQNVVIMPGVKIGAFCIIGAGSIVTKSVPAYSIAVGNPARVVKMWNFKTSSWANTGE